jgi:L-amino acid N-acyltransferase YncA
MQKPLVKSMKESFLTCFPTVPSVGITIPGIIFTIATNSERNSIVSLAMATSHNSVSLKNFGHLNAYNIYNVCSTLPRQGLAKSVMIALINHLISQGISRFILEVHPDNIAAKSLYSSLGFNKIGTSVEREVAYDVMYLSF